MTPKQQLRQMSVSKDPSINESLSNKERLHNLESDLLNQMDVINRLVVQNDKYVEYLDSEIKAKKDSRRFWVDVKKKLAVSGIWGTVVIVFTALVYAAKQWITTH